MKIFGFLTLVFSNILYASNFEVINEHVKTWKKEYDNSFIQTVHSACRLKKADLDELNAAFVKIPIRNEYYQNDKGELTMFLVKDKHGRVKKAPVVIYITGIFENPFSGLGRHIIKKFTDQGLHVISLGNPLGKENVSLRPRYMLGSFIYEAKAFYLTAKLAINNLKKLSLVEGKPSIFGISYGAFIAAVMKNIDEVQDDPISEKLVLISPPINLTWGMQNMDTIIEESEEFRDKSDLWFNIKSIRYCLNPPRVSKNKDRAIAKAIFSHMGFQRDLADQVSRADLMYEWNTVPRYSDDVFTQWRRRFLFFDYFEDFFPSLKLLYYSPKASLRSWIDLKSKNTLIFSAIDDPLNKNLTWPSTKNIFLIESGGHYGFASTEFYEKFLVLALDWIKSPD